jgi:DNA recombination protein RmuC
LTLLVSPLVGLSANPPFAWPLLLTLGGAIGLVAGWIVAWVFHTWNQRRVQKQELESVTALRQQLHVATRSEAMALARQEAAEARADELRSELERLEANRESLQMEVARVRSDRSQLQVIESELRTKISAQLEQHRQNELHQKGVHDAALADLRNFHDRALADLRSAFSNLSVDALQRQGPEFMKLAESALSRFQQESRGDYSVREERFATLLKPLEEHLAAYQTRLHQAENSQNTLLTQVNNHLEQLSSQNQALAGETERLRQVLHSNQARGRWGEETLRRVVEVAGLSSHCDFEVQVQDADKRPDLVIRLPGNRLLLIDSKVPDLDFLDGLQTSDLVRRAQVLSLHARKLRETIRGLSAKNYPGQFPQAMPDVILFLPAESLFSAALEADRDLLIWAAERRILLATPASLIGLLRAVALSWMQQEQSQNAREIGEAARQLQGRVQKFLEHFARIRDGLLRAGKAYDEAVGSYERMVRPAGERLERLGGGLPQKALPLVDPLDITLRVAPESTSAETANDRGKSMH